MIEIEELDDPMENFKDALKSESAKRQYPVRLKYFFDSLDTKENEPFKPLPHIDINDQIKGFMLYKDNKEIVERCFRHMLRIQIKRVESGEIEESTIYNYYKAAKFFCDQNDIIATWKKITRIIPSGRRDADDRVPTDDEIQRLIAYPDRRLKPIIFTMISSGIRIEAWNYLRWKHVEPKYENGDPNGKLLGAKLIIYAGEREQYFSFITPEAYKYLKSYMDYRESHGEEINGNSWVMRDLFESTIKNGVNLGKDKTPKQLRAAGIKSLLERAATSERLFKPLDLKNGEKRREWKVSHGLRKLFKTRCESAGMKSLNIEMLLGHNTGVAKSYYRPLESDMLADYQKAIPLLTIEEANKKVDKITAQLRNEMQDQIKRLEEKILTDSFDNSYSRLTEEILFDYKYKGKEGPKSKYLSKEQIDKLHKETFPELPLKDIAIITDQDKIDYFSKRHKINDKDLEVIKKYIEVEQGESGQDIMDLPNIAKDWYGD